MLIQTWLVSLNKHLLLLLHRQFDDLDLIFSCLTHRKVSKITDIIRVSLSQQMTELLCDND